MLVTIKNRQEKIVWRSCPDQSDDTQDKIDKFFELAKKSCFPIIKEITIDLLFKYKKVSTLKKRIKKLVL